VYLHLHVLHKGCDGGGVGGDDDDINNNNNKNNNNNRVTYSSIMHPR
jgi:hypothetical protein